MRVPDVHQSWRVVPGDAAARGDRQLWWGGENRIGVVDRGSEASKSVSSRLRPPRPSPRAGDDPRRVVDRRDPDVADAHGVEAQDLRRCRREDVAGVGIDTLSNRPAGVGSWEFELVPSRRARTASAAPVVAAVPIFPTETPVRARRWRRDVSVIAERVAGDGSGQWASRTPSTARPTVPRRDR